ncbi:lytic transglycosylase domain-containing protein [Pseudobdellovibrio exovorus]|uniref:Transglycosylase SLT domain-containing protein n=1 Tax=Pseudobdellovibrio exovorus JSS TaxID=1184267 RepID=M4VRH0_9BACT|nr:lytic transglycosylase domain-containing protein [Pseudobdellovibrio exovorus]AGH95779.1 hypothetical protein A11Q_1563 [Pseudobdellovibrio exovorus JSS]
METNTENNKSKLFARKIGLLSLFCTVLILNESCQMSAEPSLLSIQDEIRKTHAQELLSTQGEVPEKVALFDGDRNFSRYIEQYVQKRNKRINAESFTQTLMNLSQDHSYDPIFLLAVIQTESSFNFNAVGSVGEIGLMQIRPNTAEWISKKKNLPWKGAQALKDPEYNILLGAHYFQYLKSTMDSESLKYVNAYNMGPTSAKRMAQNNNLKKHPYFGKVVNNYLMIYADLKNMKEKEQKMLIAEKSNKQYFASLQSSVSAIF